MVDLKAIANPLQNEVSFSPLPETFPLHPKEEGRRQHAWPLLAPPQAAQLQTEGKADGGKHPMNRGRGNLEIAVEEPAIQGQRPHE